MAMRFLFFIFVVLAFVAPAYAQDRFFEALPDMPVMAGLQEVPAETVVFDKPQGRIVEVMAQMPLPLDFAMVEAFYGETLPQLGWRKTAENRYLREDEVLHILFEEHEDARFVKITVAPVDSGGGILR